MHSRSFRLLCQVAFFSAVGALLGFIDWRSQVAVFSAVDAVDSPTDSAPVLDLMPLLLLAPCLTAIAALPPWGFKVVETYWKAPLLCALAFISWPLLRHYLLYLIPTDASGGPNLFWDVLQFWADGAVKVFAMFAYIVRAMVVRAGRLIAIIFVVFVAATNLVYLLADPLQIGLALVCQYSFLLGFSALAAKVFHRGKHGHFSRPWSRNLSNRSACFTHYRHFELAASRFPQSSFEAPLQQILYVAMDH
jgi:hypothetical protein